MGRKPTSADRVLQARDLSGATASTSKTGWLRARKSHGAFRTPFDPTAINYGSDYTEGNAWQYSWFVATGSGRADAPARRRRKARSPSSTHVRLSTIQQARLFAMPRISPG
jgi:hypothetical protein